MYSVDLNRTFSSLVTPTIIACCALNLGCGQRSVHGRVAVSGQVFVADQPLKIGYVRFIPAAGGRAVAANIDKEGRFDFGEAGVAIGKNLVEVVANEQVGATGYRWHAPAKYASASTSGLEQEITGPTSEVAIHLSGDGVKPATPQAGADDGDPKNLKSRQ